MIDQIFLITLESININRKIIGIYQFIQNSGIFVNLKCLEYIPSQYNSTKLDHLQKSWLINALVCKAEHYARKWTFVFMLFDCAQL
ncbi:unnamed protein product [Paramecium sonneborni]|uniref:Uncharacterized protein n=1 Tax=Paramecium sonneborni TaxID=65129 RepID=A0A8S1RDG6_9CILI|nr:unnamed protein product [Paramecium sonneborni]